MKPQYIRRKGEMHDHLILDRIGFGGISTACGLTLLPRDLGRVKDKPGEGFEYCAACAEKEKSA